MLAIGCDQGEGFLRGLGAHGVRVLMQCGQAQAGGVQVVVEADQGKILRDATAVLAQTEQCRDGELIIAQAYRGRRRRGGDDAVEHCVGRVAGVIEGQRHGRDARVVHLVIADVGDALMPQSDQMVHGDVFGGMVVDAHACVESVVRWDVDADDRHVHGLELPGLIGFDVEGAHHDGVRVAQYRQIGEELTKLAKFIDGVRIAVIYGGQSISRQINALKRRPQIVIATPGRMLDHMQRGNIRLNAVHTMVLDEADEMLNMGFVKDVTKIIEATPPDRQLVLFSATTNQDVLTIAWKYQHEPVEITVEATKADRPQITQYVIATEQDQKTDHLLYLLDADVYQRIMIFCNTKFMTDKLTSRLVKEGYNAQCLHGDIPQSKRNVVMSDFKRGKFPILVSTDVAARGIDVDDVEAVINYDLPNENEYYLHRIGRTGRAHKHGVSFSLVTFRESVRMDEILKYMLTAPTPLKFEDDVLRLEDGTPFFDHI